ncbi:PAS domain-containing protein [Halobaculum rubrum]|uniref:PAS domain-containing protein n=1 Tax=Halobaculum rubrum TaxID=2872158 RepID=UPI001CECE2DB|nr:PAS domain-containing protein [Halobaculum rubrum]
MLPREDLADLIRFDHDRFRTRVPAVLDDDEYDTERLDRLHEPVPGGDTVVEGDSGSLAAHEGAYVERIRVLDDAPVGITLAGPAYADNPVVYANRTLRDLTGYSLDDLRGENLRLLQGPETEPDPVSELREALSTWNRVTTTLTNYRADGSTFRNRVTLVPVTDRGGTVVNWLGFQAAVEE